MDNPMTTPPQPSPVTAWAVVDKEGQIAVPITPLAHEFEKINCERRARRLNRTSPSDAPHRVVRVEIKVVETGEG